MVKVVVCDGHGTLELPNPSDQAYHFREWLRKQNITLAVASNKTRGRVLRRFENEDMRPPEIVVTKDDIGKRKPAPEFIARIAEEANVERRHIVYIGDRVKTDIITATNAGVLPFAAEYSNPGMEYGLQIPSLQSLAHYLDKFGSAHRPYFAWWLRRTVVEDVVRIYTLIYDHSWRDSRLRKVTNHLQTVLKEHGNVDLGNWNVRSVLLYLLISQCYFSGLIHEVDRIAVYPSSNPEKGNPTLEQFSQIMQRTFNTPYEPDLITRHTPSNKCQHGNRKLWNQLNTIFIPPRYRGKISGESVLVIDDFTTSGTSLEAARQLLYQANVSNVYCLAIAKYRKTHEIALMRKDWNPFEPTEFTESDYRRETVKGKVFDEQDRRFREQIWSFFEDDHR